MLGRKRLIAELQKVKFDQQYLQAIPSQLEKAGSCFGRILLLTVGGGAGVMECRNALDENDGNIENALQYLKERSLVKVEKKKDRATSQGLVEAYIHAGGRIGAIVEINCETDFVARTDEFKELAHNLAMQVAAIPPLYLSKEEIPEGPEATDIEPHAGN